MAAAPQTFEPGAVPMDPGLEVWKNNVPGIVAINRLGEYGRVRVELVNGGRVFHITPGERRMNQTQCARADLDIFTNGTLQPVALLDDEPDTPALRENPNVLDDQDIERIFRLKGEAFAQRLDQVTNAGVLARLADLAREPRIRATVQQYELVKARQHAVEASPVLSATPAREDRKQRAVTPK